MMTLKNRSLIIILAVIILILIIGFFTYSIYSFKKIELNVDGFLTCAQGRCFWTDHIHTLVLINICGTEINLSKFEGPLSEAHTHPEDNVIHWHDKLEINPDTKEFLDPTPLTLSAALQNLDISFSAQQIADKKNGDACPDGTLGNLKMLVNGVSNQDFDKYKWKDKDIIYIIFDSRSLEQVEQDQKNKPINFPRLGEG